MVRAMSTAEEKLYRAACGGGVHAVLPLLRDNPALNVNWANEFDNQRTALHIASYYGYVEIVMALLAHARINVNARDCEKQTPFLLACWHGRMDVVYVMLKDPRVDVTLGDKDGCSPLWNACLEGSKTVVMYLLSSARDLGDLDIKGKYCDGNEYSTFEVARLYKQTEIVSMLGRFASNPARTRCEIRLKLGMPLEETEIFAFTVFLSDGLLRLKSVPTPDVVANDATHFFILAMRLPRELQMLLCHRVFGSAKDCVASKDSETAFESLVNAFPSW